VYLRFYIDPETEEPHVYRHAVSEEEVEDVVTWPESPASAASPTQEKTMTKTEYPPGWDEKRVRRVLAHYETQSDDEAVAEDEAAYESTTETTMAVPVDLVPAVRELIAKRQAK